MQRYYRRETVRRCVTWCYCRGTVQRRLTAGCFCRGTAQRRGINAERPRRVMIMTTPCRLLCHSLASGAECFGDDLASYRNPSISCFGCDTFRYNRKLFAMADRNELCAFKKKGILSRKTRKRKHSSDEGMLFMQCGGNPAE